MRPKLKPIDSQVIVITGASSGTRLVTARMAAEAGAAVVAAARNEDALRDLLGETVRAGGRTKYVRCDAGRQLAAKA